MFKTLLKKQFSEVFSFIFIDRRKSKRRTAGGIALSVLLYLFIFGIVCINIYMIAEQLCAPLVSSGYAWFYFALFGLAAMFFGVLGSAFSTYNSLYVSKDNDMLFSMPIKPKTILNSRLVSVYLLSLLYIMLIFIPTLIAYFVSGSPGFARIVLAILTPLFIALLTSAVSCLLGWIISLIARRIKNKSFFTILAALIFLGLYYYFYFKMSSMLQKILGAPALIANGIKRYIYPFYLMGEGAAGDAVKFLLFALICFAAAALVYFIIYLGFAKSVISGGSISHTKKNARYSNKDIKAGTASGALFKKELLRFTSSPNYMLNANIGLIFMIAAAVLLFIKGSEIRELLLEQISVHHDALALIVCGAVCLLSTTNNTTASSVSLEGKHIWLPKSLPVEPKSALLAKLKLHLALLLPPLALLLAAVIITFRFPLMHSIMICAVSVLYVSFMAMFGLLMNLKWANLHWTNEVIPIKQSLPVSLAMFGGFGFALLLGGGYLLLASSVEPLMYLCIASVVLLAACILFFRLIVTWGARRFSELD